MRFRGRGVEHAEVGAKTAIAEEKRGNKADEEYAKAAAVRKEERAREEKRKDARKRLMFFSHVEMPGAGAELFEAGMKQAVPERFKSQPDLLLPTNRLKKAGVNIYALD